MLAFVRVELLTDRIERFNDNFLHLGHEVVLNADLGFRVVFVNVVLELVERELVPVLKLPVRLALHLHGVVGQVHEGVIHILQIYAIVTAGGAQVALREEVQVGVMCQDDPNPDVKLTFSNQKRAFDVLLNDESVKLYFIYLYWPLHW